MKKIIHLILLLTLLHSCGSDNKGSSNKKTIIEGTVTQISNLFFQQVHAQESDICSENLEEKRLYDRLECLENSQCVGQSGERCIFLLNEEKNKIIANAQVLDGKYKFELDDIDDQIYHLVVEDYDDKEYYRELVFDRKETDKKLNLDPLSTMFSLYKKTLIKEDRLEEFDLEDILEDFNLTLEDLKLFARKARRLSVRQELLRLKLRALNRDLLGSLFDIWKESKDDDLEEKSTEELKALFLESREKKESLETQLLRIYKQCTGIDNDCDGPVDRMASLCSNGIDDDCDGPICLEGGDCDDDRDIKPWHETTERVLLEERIDLMKDILDILKERDEYRKFGVIPFFNIKVGEIPLEYSAKKVRFSHPDGLFSVSTLPSIEKEPMIIDNIEYIDFYIDEIHGSKVMIKRAEMTSVQYPYELSLKVQQVDSVQYPFELSSIVDRGGWDDLNAESIDLLIENPLYSSNGDGNPLYEEDLNEGNNPLYTKNNTNLVIGTIGASAVGVAAIFSSNISDLRDIPFYDEDGEVWKCEDKEVAKDNQVCGSTDHF